MDRIYQSADFFPQALVAVYLELSIKALIKTGWRTVIFREDNLRNIFSTSLATFSSICGLLIL